ncbi:serine/threonine-protein kinase Aurora-3-like isoform X2 [Centruroides sculpturatus]|uniref:serine/threonine-protein kinase Aurora-3-like isoform X2 n=1 Tax=Centruroides sculpturatus TaxID=218467 RepID=UPI000C6DA331|nr:serine/threonine-protein kinase Aurora-3-like isoform X2 [Centruroides sculpturatus]
MKRSFESIRLRFSSEKMKRESYNRSDGAEPDGQQNQNYWINNKFNDLPANECFSAYNGDSPFEVNKFKRNLKIGRFKQFFKSIFSKLLRCCCVKEENSDSPCESEDFQSGLERLNNTKEKYKFQEIGEGSFGTVYVGRSKSSDKAIAVKAIKKRRFSLKQEFDILKEGTAWRRVSNHPHIVSFIGLFETDISHCFVCDYVNGENLTDFLEINGILSENQAKTIGAQLASAIIYIHDKEIIHRDISSNNILIDKKNEAHLIDFGLCTFERRPKYFCGTLFYLCPEILQRKEYDAYCDWWAFGVVLYEILVGKTPMNVYLEEIMTIEDFQSLPITEKLQIVEEVELTYPFELPQDAKKIIQDLLQKNPEERLTEEKIKNHKFFDDVSWPIMPEN